MAKAVAEKTEAEQKLDEVNQKQREEAAAKRAEVERILDDAQKKGGEPGAPVGDTGYFFNMADVGESNSIPRRKGSRFLPGHDAKMYKINKRFLAGEIELNEYQRAYMEERGMPLDRKAYQKEQAEKEQAKEAKRAKAQAQRDEAKAKKQEEQKAAKAAREEAKKQADA